MYKVRKLVRIYKRLDSSKPAYTITGSGGGGTHVYHWAEPRALTNRERARLQTFPIILSLKVQRKVFVSKLVYCSTPWAQK